MKLSNKLSKVSEDISVKMVDNGFVVEVGGRDHDSEWASAKIICTDVDQVFALITEAVSLPRDS